jgi:peptide/nickel transport system permease protein
VSQQLTLGTGGRTARFATSIRGVRVPILVLLAFAYVAAVVIAALLQTHLGTQSPGAIDPLSVAAKPSAAHRFGTDELGRDVLSRVVVGARTALVGPLVIAISGFVVSGLIGIGAGYIGGLFDSITMRIVDFMFALPGLLIAIVIVTIVQGGYWVAVLVLAVLNVQGDIRLVRGATLAQRSLAYVEAERVVGLSPWSIMYRHIGRNILPILLADLAVDFGGALVALAGLAFLGLGAQPGTADWGLMLTQGQAVLFENPYAALAPGIAIVLLAMSVNLIGDWLYDRRAASVGTR